MTIYHCRHCNKTHETYAEISHFYCGCDGSKHLACEQKPAPAGTPRPHDWPVYLSWRTSAATL